jgi:hypothetical protein
MAFNMNYFKGASTSQIQNALLYWMNALRPAEEVDKMKEEKAAEIVENAVIYPVEPAEPAVEAVQAEEPLCIPEPESHSVPHE